MKQWTVYYRDKNGSKTSVVIEAEDRAGVFAELKKRGISAISVAEGVSDKKPRKVAAKGASSKGRGLIAAAVAVLIAGVAAWLMWPVLENENLSRALIEKEHPITCASNANVRCVVENAEAKTTLEDVPAMSLAAQKSLERIRKRNKKNGIRDFIPPAHTSSVVSVNHFAKHFTNASDQWIAIMLTAPIGDRPIGDPETLFGERFRAQFAKSAISKIEILPEDSEEVKELKQAVIDTKKDMFARIKNGEDPCEIMKSSYRELQQLGLYKSELEAAVKAACLDDELSDQDVEDTLQAANKMLSERGVSNIKMPGIFKRRLKMKTKGIKR